MYHSDGSFYSKIVNQICSDSYITFLWFESHSLYSHHVCSCTLCPDNYEWTTWFNVDHPGGHGDYEQLEAIRFYYRSRVCEAPRAIEARTTEWVPARETGETVHADPTVGFWCLNEEQGPERNCSNYAVRFLCPKGLIL